jgi:hypothetical protein
MPPGKPKKFSILDVCPAWPPGTSRSSTIVERPSDAAYTAAARPAGPAPTITMSYSERDGGDRKLQMSDSRSTVTPAWAPSSSTSTGRAASLASWRASSSSASGEPASCHSNGWAERVSMSRRR